MRSFWAAAIGAWAMCLASPVAWADGKDSSRKGAASHGRDRHFEDLTGDLPAEAITAVAVDPDDDQVLYAGSDGFLFKSDDGGETWRVILSFPRGLALDEDPQGTGDGDVVDEPRLVPLAGGSDGGTGGSGGAGGGASTETDLPDGNEDVVDLTSFTRTSVGVRDIAFVPGSGSVFYVATPRGLFRTTTKGGSFTRIDIPGATAANDVRDVLVDPGKPSRIYLATASGVIISRDGGNTFGRAPGGSGAALCLAAGPGGNVVLIGLEAGLARSIDGGESFLDVLLRGLPPFTGVASVSVSEVSGTQYAGTANGLWVGERGAALLERYDGIPQTHIESVLADPVFPRGVVVGTRTAGVLFSNDAGVAVDEEAEQVPAADVLAIARGKKPNDVVVATDRGLFRSVPGSGVTLSSSGLKKLRALWAKEPSIEETAHQALAWNRINPMALRSMQSRAAIAKILPQATASFDYTHGETSTAEQFILLADQLPAGSDPGSETDQFGNTGALLLQPEFGDTWVFLVSLKWDLDKLILNEDEVAVGRRIPSWWGAERRILDRVRTAWSARRRVMTEVALGEVPRTDKALKADAQRQLRLDELTAELDAITGGAFSDSIRAGGTGHGGTHSDTVEEKK